MSSTYGEHLKLTIFGQSHGPAIGMTLDGIPAGLTVDHDQLQSFLNRRAPGQNTWSTPRKESDKPEFLSGIVDGHTCGAPISAVIYNQNHHSNDYNALKDCPRPGHADYTAHMKYGEFADIVGGGHFSGRLTAPLCIAGGMCKQWLEAMGIFIGAHIIQIGDVHAPRFDPTAPDFGRIGCLFPASSQDATDAFSCEIDAARSAGDSVGGRIECAVTGVPAGLGDPMFGGVENRLAQILYGIPAVKNVGFGSSEEYALLRGSDANDPFIHTANGVQTATNHCGGILGGITNGMPIVFDVTFKPTPSISLPQKTVNLPTGVSATIQICGRHDPCIVPRAVPVVEAAAAIAIFDMILGRTMDFKRM
jgi:chorismate synthase